MRSYTRRCEFGRATSEGFTLIELLVAMMIFGIFLAVMSAGITTMFTSSAKTQGIGDATTQNEQVFTAFERDFRAADQVEVPYKSGNDDYVQFEALDATGSPQCYQWRYLRAAGQIQQRTGPTTSTGWSSLQWKTVATGVTNDTNDLTQLPFQTYGTYPVFVRPALALHLADHQGGNRGGTATLTTTVTAENVTTVNGLPIARLSASAAVFSDIAHPVCKFGGVPK